jgi:hypothetical protein
MVSLTYNPNNITKAKPPLLLIRDGGFILTDAIEVL